jgi:large subunit ribosomal protein L23
MRNPHDVLIKPLVSEKSISLMEQNKYQFEVTNVTTMNVKGKMKRMGRYIGKRPDRKKAIVTLKSGDKIEVFEGL